MRNVQGGRMKLENKIQKLQQLNKEIEDCEHLIQLYTTKKAQFQKKYDELVAEDIFDIEYINKLQKKNEQLLEDLDYLGTWRCPKCGHYSMKDFICHVCRYDKSEIPEDYDELEE